MPPGIWRPVRVDSPATVYGTSRHGQPIPLDRTAHEARHTPANPQCGRGWQVGAMRQYI